MAFIGIDLGTTNSLVSVFRDEKAELIPNALGEVLTPSVVGFSDEDELLVGRAARDRLVTHPEKTFARFKRHMGTDKEYKYRRQSFRAEDLSALVLKSLKADAESYLGEQISGAVITVPAYFNDVQRKATFAAAKIAGLKVDRLINEPTAAALAYGINYMDDNAAFLVLDLGGGTFDVSILERFEGILEVRASAGDAFLGGEDYTDEIGRLIASKLDLNLDKEDKKIVQRVRSLAEQAKFKLSEADTAKLNYAAKKQEQTVEISRDEVEEACSELTKRLRLPIQRAISDSRLNLDVIDKVILVGGATRMPLFRKMVTRALKKFPEHQIDPDHVVGMGASIQAGLIAKNEGLKDVVLTDVAPFTMGTNISQQTSRGLQGGFFQPIIERNTVIPCSRVVRNEAAQMGQEKIDLHIFQGESPRVENNVLLGKMSIPIPKNFKEHESIDIRFTYDVSGVLEVLVTVVSTGVTGRSLIEGNPGSLSQVEIEKRFKALEKLKIHPRDKEENLVIFSQLERIFENSLDHERKQIANFIAEFESILQGQNETDIANAREKLTAIIKEFESRTIF